MRSLLIFQKFSNFGIIRGFESGKSSFCSTVFSEKPFGNSRVLNRKCINLQSGKFEVSSQENQKFAPNLNVSRILKKQEKCHVCTANKSIYNMESSRFRIRKIRILPPKSILSESFPNSLEKSQVLNSK